MRFRVALSVIVTISLALFAFSEHVVRATNFGSAGTPGLGGLTNGVWLTQNDPWTVRGRGLTDAYRIGLNQTMNASYFPTDLDVAYTRYTQEQASCVKKTADGGDSEVLSDHDIGHINSQY